MAIYAINVAIYGLVRVTLGEWIWLELEIGRCLQCFPYWLCGALPDSRKSWIASRRRVLLMEGGSALLRGPFFYSKRAYFGHPLPPHECDCDCRDHALVLGKKWYGHLKISTNDVFFFEIVNF